MLLNSFVYLITSILIVLNQSFVLQTELGIDIHSSVMVLGYVGYCLWRFTPSVGKLFFLVIAALLLFKYNEDYFVVTSFIYLLGSFFITISFEKIEIGINIKKLSISFFLLSLIVHFFYGTEWILSFKLSVVLAGMVIVISSFFMAVSHINKSMYINMALLILSIALVLPFRYTFAIELGLANVGYFNQAVFIYALLQLSIVLLVRMMRSRMYNKIFATASIFILFIIFDHYLYNPHQDWRFFLHSTWFFAIVFLLLFISFDLASRRQPDLKRKLLILNSIFMVALISFTFNNKERSEINRYFYPFDFYLDSVGLVEKKAGIRDKEYDELTLLLKEVEKKRNELTVQSFPNVLILFVDGFRNRDSEELCRLDGLEHYADYYTNSAYTQKFTRDFFRGGNLNELTVEGKPFLHIDTLQAYYEQLFFPDYQFFYSYSKQKKENIEKLRYIGGRYSSDVIRNFVKRIDVKKSFFAVLYMLDTHNPLREFGKAKLLDRYRENQRYFCAELEKFLSGETWNKLKNNTRLIVLADHGEEFFEHNKVLHGFQVYEESIKPLLMTNFTISPSTYRNDMISLDDVMKATFFIDHTTQLNTFISHAGFSNTYAIIDLSKKIKYVVNFRKNFIEKYNLKHDPYEKYNLSNGNELKQVIELIKKDRDVS